MIFMIDNSGVVSKVLSKEDYDCYVAYDFGEKFTRIVDNGGEFFVHNAPKEVTDADARRIIDGGGTVQPWGWMSIPKSAVGKFEVRK